jgi:hypothetical protein
MDAPRGRRASPLPEGLNVDLLNVPVIGKRLRKTRINALVDQLAAHEWAMRDICAALLDLSDPDDDLAVEVKQLLATLDG